jgi:hypothetical protein
VEYVVLSLAQAVYGTVMSVENAVFPGFEQREHCLAQG